MTSFGAPDDDDILPARILHKCDDVWNGDVLEQRYNHLVYEFEIGPLIIRARSYLDEIDTVSFLSCVDMSTSMVERVTRATIDPRILAYFRRRYPVIQVWGDDDYEVIE